MKTPVLESLCRPSGLQFFKRFQHRRFPVNIAETFENTSFEEHLRMTAS